MKAQDSAFFKCPSDDGLHNIVIKCSSGYSSGGGHLQSTVLLSCVMKCAALSNNVLKMCGVT